MVLLSFPGMSGTLLLPYALFTVKTLEDSHCHIPECCANCLVPIVRLEISPRFVFFSTLSSLTTYSQPSLFKTTAAKILAAYIAFDPVSLMTSAVTCPFFNACLFYPLPSQHIPYTGRIRRAQKCSFLTHNRIFSAYPKTSSFHNVSIPFHLASPTCRSLSN